VAGFVFAEGEGRKRRGRDGKGSVVKVLECVGEHYEVQEVQRARVYRWCPATITLECECGQRPTLTSSRTTCVGCGTDHMDVFAEVLGIHKEDEGNHPWRSLRSYFSRRESI